VRDKNGRKPHFTIERRRGVSPGACKRVSIFIVRCLKKKDLDLSFRMVQKKNKK